MTRRNAYTKAICTTLLHHSTVYVCMYSDLFTKYPHLPAPRLSRLTILTAPLRAYSSQTRFTRLSQTVPRLTSGAEGYPAAHYAPTSEASGRRGGPAWPELGLSATYSRSSLED